MFEFGFEGGEGRGVESAFRGCDSHELASFVVHKWGQHRRSVFVGNC